MRRVNKAYEITDAKISFVSLVDKAANKRKFLLTKAEGGQASFTTYGRIVKTDSENHYVTGIVYEPMEEDSHGNYMTAEEITKAAYWYAKNGDKVDIQHSFEPLDNAAVVENWVAKADFKLGDEVIKEGTWLMTVEVTDEGVWESIEKGEITGFSMGGLGNYSEEDVELDSVSKQQETSEKKGLIKQLAAALGLNVVEKGAMAELYEQRSKGTLFWNAFNSLEEILYQYDNITGRWVYETNEDKVRECLEEFNQIITSILTGKESITKAIQTNRPIEKAGKKMSGKNKEALQCIYDNLGTFLAAFDEPEAGKTDDKKDGKKVEKQGNDNIIKEEKEVTKQEVEAIVSKSIEAVIAKATGKTTDPEVKDPEKKDPEVTDTKDKKDVKKSEEELTPEAIQTMVEQAITKAMQPPEERITAEQAQDMITKAVAAAVEPILKSKGLPSNLNGTGAVEKAEEHYLHGIL